jgi:hypothetical protein
MKVTVSMEMKLLILSDLVFKGDDWIVSSYLYLQGKGSWKRLGRSLGEHTAI